jgi:serine/threonine protein kinase/Flp pilus assembly protein TadD
MRPANTAVSTDCLDSVLEAFERDCALSGKGDLRAYLPEVKDPAYARIAVELIRVDLELSWARGEKKRLEDYRAIAPPVFADPRYLAGIAFEEYRLRTHAGESVDSSEYRQRYSIDTSAWRKGNVSESIPSGTSWDGRTAGPVSFPAVGSYFSGFELIEILGHGAFGTVYLARQRDLASREMVLKITTRRTVEPQRLARLQHTNIVPIYSVHEEDELLGICMPYFGHKTLADVVGGFDRRVDHAITSTLREHRDDTLREVPSPPELTDRNTASAVLPELRVQGSQTTALSVLAVVELMLHLADGLAHAHSRAIVHSDLKPANILLSDDGTPMLLDFNLSSEMDSAHRATLTVGGTLPYMAPEHLLATLHGGQVAPSSDVFSLGVIFFELLLGRRPFLDRAGEFEDTVDAMIADRQARLAIAELKRLRTRSVASIVERCLAPDPQHRYKNAHELAEDLRRHQQDLPLKHAPNVSVRERVSKWSRRNATGLRYAAAMVLVAVACGCAALYFARANRLANLEAATAFDEFQRDALAANLNLLAPGAEPELKKLGQAAGERALSRFGPLEAAAGSNLLGRLSPEQQSEVRTMAASLADSLASISVAKNGTFAKQQSEPVAREGSESYGQVMHALEQHRYNEAVPVAEKLSRVGPQDPIRWLLLGNSYAGAGRLADAESCYTALIALQPNAMAGYFYRGLCRADRHEYGGAIEDFTSAIELRPNVATSRINRALAYHAIGEEPKAESDATAAIEAGLADTRALFVRAVIREALGNAEGAKADRERGFAIAPTDDKGWVARGISRLREDPQLAAEEFESGLKDFPTSKSLLQNLVHVYGDRLGKAELANARADSLVELAPADPIALASRAVLRARSGSVEGAHKDAERVAASRPAPVTSLQLACVYALTSRSVPADVPLAVSHLQKALASDPKLAVRAESDPDLLAIRDNPEVTSLLSAAKSLLGEMPQKSKAVSAIQQ